MKEIVLAEALQFLAGLITVLFISRLCMRVLWPLVWRPYAVARSLRIQGIRGPPYILAAGSLLECRRMLIEGRKNALDPGCHNYASLVYPFFQKWVSDYGKTFLFWLGSVPSICSTDIDLVRQVLADRSDLFQKDFLNSTMEVGLGNGLLLVNGDTWKRHRRVVQPVFNQEKLKCMSAIASECTEQMMDRWCRLIQNDDRPEAETDMMCDFDELTKAVIAREILGKNYKDASEVLEALKELQALVITAFLDPLIPGLRYLPTRRNRRTQELDKVVTNKMKQLINARLAEKEAGGAYGDDLLGLMLQAQYDKQTLSTNEVIGECKTFLAAGHDTTANLLAWSMFLLSSYPEWQDKVREEILRECPNNMNPTGVDALAKLKLLNMTLLETLRLYNPLAFLLRKTTSDTVLANIKVPKGTMITIPIAMLHRDIDVWGLDADNFNPMRFENGISKAANHPNALLAFSSGQRSCIGQNFAMIQVQIVMVMILRRFSFSVSPKYIHKPTNNVTLTPKYGLPMNVRILSMVPSSTKTYDTYLS